MEISPYQDTIYSRDIDHRIETLTDLAQDRPLNNDETRELEALTDLRDAFKDDTDWNYGITLINDAYFTQYARELAEDYGMISRTPKWPVTCINWDEAADELKYDYHSADYLNREFYAQSSTHRS